MSKLDIFWAACIASIVLCFVALTVDEITGECGKVKVIVGEKQ